MVTRMNVIVPALYGSEPTAIDSDNDSIAAGSDQSSFDERPDSGDVVDYDPFDARQSVFEYFSSARTDKQAVQEILTLSMQPQFITK